MCRKDSKKQHPKFTSHQELLIVVVKTRQVGHKDKRPCRVENEPKILQHDHSQRKRSSLKHTLKGFLDKTTRNRQKKNPFLITS